MPPLTLLQVLPPLLLLFSTVILSTAVIFASNFTLVAARAIIGVAASYVALIIKDDHLVSNGGSDFMLLG